jgi:hypothetical protein
VVIELFLFNGNLPTRIYFGSWIVPRDLAMKG